MLHARKCVVVSDVDGQEVTCMLRGKLFEKMKGHTKPVAVGDRVGYTITDDTAALEEILPRKNSLTRPAIGRHEEIQTIAANIDRMIIVASIKDPPLKTGLIDRFLVAAALEEIDPVLCLNKIDLLEDGSEENRLLEETHALYTNLGYEVYSTSALDGSGVDALKRMLRQGTSLMVGHSGVGKSTLLNGIDPALKLKTGSLSARQGKGKHTTTHVSLLSIAGGGFVVDTPGIREFGLFQIKPSDLGHFFPEIAGCLSECLYHDCTHRHEPDCAVLKARSQGRIHPDRYKSYLKLLEDLL
ncbi:MAG: ribosome small subunit-dependent GTPase A [Planctomycetota bacterium]